MSHDIYDILQRLDEGLNPQQRSVPQLPALFKPKSISVLGTGKDPEHPMHGYAVGTNEDAEEPTAEAEVIPIRPSGVKFANRKDYLDKRDVIFRILSQPGLDPETKEDLKARLSDFEKAAKTQGLITEDEDEQENPMRQAVMRRIVHQHPEWITRYGAEALVQAIDDVTEGEDDWEEIGSSDVSAYVHYVKDALDDRMGSREEMDDRKPFAEQGAAETSEPVTATIKITFTPDDIEVVERAAQLVPDAKILPHIVNQYEKIVGIDREGDAELRLDLSSDDLSAIQSIIKKYGRRLDETGILHHIIEELDRQDISESAETATEDVISTVKRKLGDYLQDVATAIQKDPDLLDKVNQAIDQVGPAVKTIQTDDGHEIKIHGNEDDGFRISIKNRPGKSSFKSLDEATMACEMYCAHRRNKAMTADYIEEKRP